MTVKPDSSGFSRRKAEVMPMPVGLQGSFGIPVKESARLSPTSGCFGVQATEARDEGSLKPGEPHDRLQGATNLHCVRGANRRSREERQGRNETRRLASSGRRCVEQSTTGSGRASRTSMEGIFQKQSRGVWIRLTAGSRQGTRTAAFETLVHCDIEDRPRVGIANDPGQGHEGFKLWDNRPRDSRPSVGSAKVSRPETGSARPRRAAGKANDPQPKGE
jgi:hypothetical protein